MSQFLPRTDPETISRNRARNGYFILGILMFIASLVGAFFAYIGYVNSYPQLYIIAGLLAVNIIFDIWLLALIRKGDVTRAMGFTIALFLASVIAVPVFTKGVWAVVAASAFVITLAISRLTLPSRHKTAGMASGVLAAALVFALDMLLGDGRFDMSQVRTYAPYIVTIIFFLIFLILIQEFKNFSLRVKVAFGILATGAVTVSVLVAFGFNRSATITTYLLDQYKSSNANNIKQQVAKQAKNAADQTDVLFATLVRDINIISDYRANIEEQKEIFSLGTYWDAKTRLFQLSGGQYGNSDTDPASIFIPSTISLNEALLADLNTTAHLDFYASNYLKNHPEAISIYFISKSGSTTYYPNIDLANNIPPDFDPRIQPFYTISEPANNSDREPKWVPAYQDPAGQGLLVTLSSPVYSNDNFLGVIGIDFQLEYFTEKITNTKIGQTGYAFLVDQEGHILTMPPEGYELFGMQAENIPVNESPKQSVIGKGSPELQKAVTRMMNGLIGIEIVPVNNENAYVAFAPLNTPNYRFGIVTPEKEFTADIIASENETQKQIQSALQSISTLLVVLFVVAATISFVVGQIITNPLIRLTKTVEKIAAGDISVRAIVETQDETGRLAASVNKMNDQLKNTLASLEERISERTQELEKTNEVNARRAAQFQTVVRIARAISSTQTLEVLLPQIVETISRQFDYYHVGIFLMDSRHEYAILVAANSEGGQKMLARNHRLPVGEVGIVGYVTSVGQPRVALDVGSDATYFNNPDLPNTHSEIALPLRIGAEVFGALDVQSTESNAFSEEDINVLSTLADQVSIAIQNARSYQQSREALAKSEKISLELSGQRWKNFIEQQAVSGYYFDGIDTKAVAPGHVQSQHDLSISLNLRGANIGTIKINALDPNHEWTDDELAMVQAAADRAALALENARLLQESQKRAAKERAIGEISAKIGGVTDLETIIQTAMQELGNTLPGTDIAVQFTDAPTRQ